MIKAASSLMLRILGWKVDYTLPKESKYVLVGAPHTSNWDLPLALLGMAAIGFRFNWVAKDSLFRCPLSVLMKRLGGVPVNRRIRTGFIQQMVSIFKQKEELVLLIAPEGTRRKTEYWKTGFYYIAQDAGVPIVLGYIDYGSKAIGIGPLFYPSGDIDSDIEVIREFYSDKKGKYSHQRGEIKIRPCVKFER